MSQSNYPLRLQTSLLDEVRRIARLEGASVNQFINVAVAEKLATMRVVSALRERAERGDPAGALAILDRLGGEPPRPGDEIPATTRLAARKAPAQRPPR
ncbi:MAG: hypothetical protein IT561_18530 [Alphaproteobacteria bacterium]|nr:hypothetical protein [Alphaproteobacteria bacterium]